jgi:hypothetical protein
MSVTEHAATTDLGGVWFLRHDPRDEGLTSGWADGDSSGNWIEGRVPDAWQRTLGVAARGVVWYRRALPARDAGSRWWVEFDSVATDCTVFVGGREIGRHVGDFLPFSFEVPAGVEGALVLRVDQLFAERPPKGVLTELGHLTKGFHDVLSLQHGGVWGGVRLRRTGAIAIETDGVHVRADHDLGFVEVTIALHPHSDAGEASIEVDGLHASAPISPGERSVSLRLEFDTWRVWSQRTPHLYRLRASVRTGEVLSDERTVRFGFRKVTTGGPGNTRILLNGEPVLIRGILHWGHEPQGMAPAPTPEEVRAQFAWLRKAGFNCVCLCMVYLPAWFYDIADETGMLLWQEHPVWKSEMDDSLLPEYRRLLSGCFRRDRNHPSIVIVSGSCEHERIHPDLAAWWWEQARAQMPGTLAQVQTAFMAWTNPAQTDLHDEHVYENSGRWPAFLRDVRAEIDRLGGKPFVMGETIIANSWPDTRALRALADRSGPPMDRASLPVGERWATHTPWYISRGLEECEAFERSVADRFGVETLDRFRRQASRYGYELRKWQAELFRMDPGNAGWVMNHIRDVPACRCGFMDDLDRWRFDPSDCARWLGDVALLARTPDHRQGFAGGKDLRVEMLLSNFGEKDVAGHLTVALSGAGAPKDKPEIRVPRGNVGVVERQFRVPSVEAPTELSLLAGCSSGGSSIARNRWSLWAFPDVGDLPSDVVRLDGLAYSRKDREPTFEDRGYSSGWGLKCRSWAPLLPELDVLAFRCPLWRFDAPMPAGTRGVVTTTLTRGLVEYLERGGRVVLLANRGEGGLSARLVMLWGQVPLVVEQGPLSAGDSEWIVDLLHHDLTRRWQAAVPTQERGWADKVLPIVRLVYTHDSGVPSAHDAVFAAQVGSGVLAVSTLDHTDEPGRYLLDRLVRWTIDAEASAVGGEGLTREDLLPFARAGV